MVATPTGQPTTDYGFLLGTLREVLTTMKAEHPTLASRLDRAASLLVTRDLRPGPLGGWLVESERQAGEFYWVTRGAAWTCCCKDYERHMSEGQPCKHILTIQLLIAAVEFEGPEPPAPIPFPVPDYADDEPIPYELTPLALHYLDRPAA